MQRFLFQCFALGVLCLFGACDYEKIEPVYPTFETIRDSTDGANRRYFDVIQTSDGKFVAAGLHNTTSEYNHLLDKFDREGNVLWSQEFGREENLTSEVLELPGHDLLVAGSQFQSGFVTKTSDIGTPGDTYTVPNELHGFASSSIEAAGIGSDGSVWLFGIATFQSGPDKFLLIRLETGTSPMESSFFKTYDAPMNNIDAGSSGLQLSRDAQFVIVATTVRNDFITPQQGVLLKFPVSGQAPLQKLFTGISLFDVALSVDGKYCFITGAKGNEVFAQKVPTADLDREEWSNNTYPGQTGQGIVATDDGGAALTGVGPIGNKQLAFLYRLDANGTLQQPTSLFIAGDAQLSDLGQAIIRTPDGFVVAGYTNRKNPDHFAGYLIKTDPLGAVKE